MAQTIQVPRFGGHAAEHPCITSVRFQGNSGKPRFDSDVDIAVLATSPLTPEQHLDLIQSISTVTSAPPDLIDLNVEHGFVARDAIVDGKIL